MQMKRLLLYWVALAILVAVAISAGQWDTAPTLLTQYAEALGTYTETQESDAWAWAKTQNGQLEASTAPSEAVYTVVGYRADSISFCSNTKVIPTVQDLQAFKTQKERFVARLPLGWFWVSQKSTGNQTTAILVPLRYHLDTRADSGNGPFPADKNISSNVTISEKPTDFPIYLGGQAVLWLQADGPVQAAWLQWIQLIFIALALALLLRILNGAADALVAKYGTVVGIATVAIGIAALIGINRILQIWNHLLDGLPIFAHRFPVPSLLGHSVGDCLWGVGLLGLGALFMLRHNRSAQWPPSSENGKLGLAIGCYALSMAALIAVGNLTAHLVAHSGLAFNMGNLLANNSLTLLSIAAAAMALVSASWFGQSLVSKLSALDISKRQHTTAIGIATLIALGLAYLSVSDLNPLTLVLFAVLFAALLYVSEFWELPGFGWALVWLLFAASFLATVLHTASIRGDRTLRAAYAEALANPRDTENAEQRFATVFQALKADETRLGVLLKPWPFKADEADLRRYVNDVLYRENYLFQHYRVQVYAYDRDTTPLLIGQKRDYTWTAHQNWAKGTALPNVPGVRYLVDAEGNFRYMMLLEPQRMGNPSDPAQIWCFFDQEYPKPTQVYAHLFFFAPYKNLTHLNTYDFGVSRGPNTVVERGPIQMTAFADATPGRTEEHNIQDNSRVYAVHKTTAAVAAVGRPTVGLLKPIYLFAILFTLASVLLFGLVLANSRFNFLPQAYSNALSTKGSLAKRIHYWNIATLGLAFFVIGLLSYRHFNQSARDAERSDLAFRSDAILNNLKMRVNASTLTADSLRRVLPQTVGTLAASLAMDANFYDPAGHLRFSTREELAKLGILPNQMNPVALATFSKTPNTTTTVLNESLANAEYSTQYMAIRNAQNQLIGYLGIPNSLDTGKPGAEVSDFIGVLAALYVFLLLLAFAVTAWLSDSIIKPIKEISKGIEGTNFEQQNEHIKYKNEDENDRDELSGLIDRYNAMVDKLEASKTKIIKLEREGAWREMARQVAHDIKNPLTTMKLSMQQLERVSNNPEQAAAYLKKAIVRLIEQIDSLAQIASEFSMFANLDIRQKSDMVLNEVVESVYDLFSEQKQVELSLEIPEEQYHILGDKNHLIRVFNNLVINAIQAIPSDRQGKIRVSLTRKGETAFVTISDNGGGIPPEIRNRVFEPNFTTKTSGSGLGLAICRKIIEAHDGTIDFSTRDNEGTDFMVELPIKYFNSGN